MMQHRYSSLAYPAKTHDLCPYSRPNEKAAWGDAVRTTILLEAVRGVGPILIHRLRKAWREGDRIANLGTIGARLPKYQVAIFFQCLELDGYLRPFHRFGYAGAGGRPTVSLELLKMPPPAEEYVLQVRDEVRRATVQESLLPELAVFEREEDERTPSLLEAFAG